MNRNIGWRISAWLMIILLAVPPELFSQEAEQSVVFKPEELEQLCAPIALHPDSLISQILMASTYPLEVALADRWVKQNASLKGDALTKALEAQDWDPSVKSLVNFPQVLTMEHDPKTPLFLYLAFTAPHAPYQAPKEYLDRYKNIADPTRRAYAAMAA